MEAIENNYKEEICGLLARTGGNRFSVFHSPYFDRKTAPRKHTTEALWCLHGQEASAQACSLGGLSFPVVDCSVPSVNDLCKMKCRVTLKNSQPATTDPDKRKVRNLLPVPAKLVIPIWSSSSSHPADVGMLVARLLIQWDTACSTGDETCSEHQEHLGYIVQFLWAVAHNKVMTVKPDVIMDERGRSFATTKAHEYLSAAVPPAPTASPTSTGPMLAGLSLAFNNLADAVKHGALISSLGPDHSPGEKAWSKLDESVQQLILRATDQHPVGTTNDDGDVISGELLSAPTADFLSIMACKSASSEKQRLSILLKSEE